jgi:glucose-6-phosphate isomerase
LLEYSAFSPAVLLPTAVLGRDVISLLCGATALNRPFRAAPPAENIVLQYAGVSHLLATRRGMTRRVLVAWVQALEGVARWYQHLSADGGDAPAPRPAAPATVATWQRPVPGPAPAAGCHDHVVTNLIVDQWRCDPLPVEPNWRTGDPADDHRTGTVPELMAAAVREAGAAHRRAGRPSADLRLPHLDEAALGQLCQMLLLATAVERRLNAGRESSK